MAIKDFKHHGLRSTLITRRDGTTRKVSAIGYTSLQHGDVVQFCPRINLPGQGEVCYGAFKYSVVWEAIAPSRGWALKILIAEDLAGCVIGTAGSSLKEAQDASGGTVHVSRKGVLFPSTRERVCIVLGKTLERVVDCAERLLTPVFTHRAGGPGGGYTIRISLPAVIADALHGEALRGVQGPSSRLSVLPDVCEKMGEQLAEVQGTLPNLSALLQRLLLFKEVVYPTHSLDYPPGEDGALAGGHGKAHRPDVTVKALKRSWLTGTASSRNRGRSYSEWHERGGRSVQGRKGG